MVQQMIEVKCSEYGLANCVSTAPTNNKKQQLLPKKVALRDVHNGNVNIFTRIQTPNMYISRYGGPIPDDQKVTGIKRSKTDSTAPLNLFQYPGSKDVKRLRHDLPENSACPQPSCSNGNNPQLVYVRRKAETELGKNNTSQQSTQQQLQQFFWVQESGVPCVPVFAPIPSGSVTTFSHGGPSIPNSMWKPASVLPGCTPGYATTSDECPSTGKTLNKSSKHWTERYKDLQKYLKSCDESSREDYVQMLRALSAAERSQHARELEQRAIDLTVVERYEFDTMRALNIMDKSPPIYGTSINTDAGVSSGDLRPKTVQA